MSVELLPCPFCGGAAKIQTDGESGYWIECTNTGCGTSTNIRIALMDDVSVVLAEQWNRRAALDIAAGEGVLTVGTLAWSLVATNGNIIIWSRNRSTVAKYQSRYPTATLTPIIGAAGVARDGIPGHLLEFVQAIANNHTVHDDENDETFCRGCSVLLPESDEFIPSHQPGCIVPRAQAMLTATPSATAEDSQPKGSS